MSMIRRGGIQSLKLFYHRTVIDPGTTHCDTIIVLKFESCSYDPDLLLRGH